jgi:hypothetical protein
MLNETEKHLESAIALAAQQQGLSFASHSDAQRHLEKTKEEIRQAFLHCNAALTDGLNYLKEMNCGYVSTISAKLLKSQHSSKKLSKLIEQEILVNEDIVEQFINAINTFYEWEDNQTVQNAVTVLMRLFPLHPQPYIYLGTLIWRTDGIAGAEMYYSKIVEAIEDPALDYFAADCLYKNGNKDRAKELLLRAMHNTTTSPDMYQDIRQLILKLLEQCLRARATT